MVKDRQVKATAFCYTTTRVTPENTAKLVAITGTRRHILAVEKNSSGEDHYQGYVRFDKQVRKSFLYELVPDLQVEVAVKEYPEWLSELYITNVEEWKKEVQENETYLKYLHEKEQGTVIINIGKNKDKKHVENTNEQIVMQQMMRLLDGEEVGDILRDHPLLCAMGNNHDKFCNAKRLFVLRKRHLDGELGEHMYNEQAKIPWSSFKRLKYESQGHVAPE